MEKKHTEWLSPLEFMERFKIGRNTIYRALQTDQIPHVRIGTRYFIPADALHRMITEKGVD